MPRPVERREFVVRLLRVEAGAGSGLLARTWKVTFDVRSAIKQFEATIPVDAGEAEVFQDRKAQFHELISQLARETQHWAPKET